MALLVPALRYPQMAAQTGIVGIVRNEATVGTDGHVHDPHVVSGPMPLRNAALHAVKEWMYSLRRVHGQAVDAPATIEVHFSRP